MKTTTIKNAFKLFLFLAILLSAKAFSHPKLPNCSSSGDCETKMGYSVAPKSNAKTAKNSNTSQGNATSSKVRLKVSVNK